jgi:3-hydroxyisobutyrate dehydrogenase-like beta-hydroxyacid dehydrogenase
MTAVGFIGLGVMGAPMAGRLLAAGHRLVVFDAKPDAVRSLTEAGAQAARSPREVADRARCVFVCLPTPEVVEQVGLGDDGLLHGSAIQTYVDVSTTGADTAERIASALGARGVACVDAPVSGGPAGARAGTLSMMLAGSPEAIAAARPLLDVLGRSVFVVGDEPGQGQTVKVINNLMSAAAIAITAEALTVGVKAGLDPATVLEVVGASSGANNAAATKFPPHVLTRRFDHGFRLSLMAKDVRLCLSEARRRQVPMLLGGAVEQLWSLAEAVTAEGADCTELVRLVEGWADARIEPRGGEA